MTDLNTPDPTTKCAHPNCWKRAFPWVSRWCTDHDGQRPPGWRPPGAVDISSVDQRPGTEYLVVTQ